jgi:hypothetical protein
MSIKTLPAAEELLTLPPLLVQLHHAVHQANISESAALRLAHHLGIAPLICNTA